MECILAEAVWQGIGPDRQRMYNPFMTRDHFERIWRAFLRRRPFLPFTLELVNGSRLEVNHPESVTLHEEWLVYNSTRGIRSVFEYNSVIRFIDSTGTA
jgi:hypothetical protein